MKVLNLYACLGGNRLKWTDCDVTAVEIDPDLARMYQERFPDDEVIVGDAHEYLLKNYMDFDFIWSSPPCPSHSRARFWSSKGRPEHTPPIYPDMKLWQEIVFLKSFTDCKWIVENVVPYYEPLIQPSNKIGKHYFWSNFLISKCDTLPSHHMSDQSDIEAHHEIDLSGYKGKQRKNKIARNMVHFDVGLHIFNLAKGIHEQKQSNQLRLL